jgi:hypothetical protein
MTAVPTSGSAILTTPSDTEIYEGMPDGDSPPEVNVITFTELPDGRTRLEMLMQCPTKEMRDVILDSGMEAGMQDGMDLLEGLAIELRGLDG